MNSSMKLHKPLMLLHRNYGQINLEKLLSEENKLKTIEKFKKYTKLRVGDKNPDKHAAILIPLCITKNNEISVLYTIRSNKLRNYSGQVCFPGNFTSRFHLLWPEILWRWCGCSFHRWKDGWHGLSRDRVRPPGDRRRDWTQLGTHQGELWETFSRNELARTWLFLDLGCGLADHPSRWTIDCANYRRDPQLHTRNAHEKPRRSVQDFYYFAGSTSRSELLPPHSV